MCTHFLFTSWLQLMKPLILEISTFLSIYLSPHLISALPTLAVCYKQTVWHKFKSKQSVQDKSVDAGGGVAFAATSTIWLSPYLWNIYCISVSVCLCGSHFLGSFITSYPPEDRGMMCGGNDCISSHWTGEVITFLCLNCFTVCHRCTFKTGLSSSCELCGCFSNSNVWKS